MRKLIESIKGLFKSKKVEALEKEVLQLRSNQEKLIERVEKMDEFVQSARELETKRNLKVNEKTKWLRGYPDQTKQKKKEV